MAGGYVICEYDSVKQEFPEFQEVMRRLRDQLIAKAESDWAPSKYGGIDASAGQFSETTIMPQLFVDITGTRLTTWEQWFNATGVQTIMRGVGTGGTIPRDYKVGLVGLAFLDPVIRISEFKMQIGDRKLPRINIEEAFCYNHPAVVFEEGFILDEQTSFDLVAYILTQGPQRIKLLGTQLNRIPNKLQVTNTGAALA